MQATFENGVLHFYPEGDDCLNYYSFTDTSVFVKGGRIKTSRIQEIEIHSGFVSFMGAFCGVPVKKLFIPDGVTDIGWSIYNSKNIEEVSFPATLQKIDKNSLSNCPNLRKIEFRGGFSKGLKIGNQVYGRVFNITNAEKLFELDTADEFKAYLFNKDFVVDSMKMDVLFAYLKGKTANGKFEQAILRYAKKDKESIFKTLLKRKDLEMTEAFLKLFLKEKSASMEMDYFYEMASSRSADDVKQVISRLKTGT